MAAAGLSPEVRPEIFESLKAIAVAMDATREDRQVTNQDLLRKLELLLRNYTQFDTSNLVSIVEELVMSALVCGTIMEKRDVKAIMVNNAANARRHKSLVSHRIDEVIKLAILTRYGKIPKSITSNAISTNIRSEVSFPASDRRLRRNREAASQDTRPRGPKQRSTK